MAYQQKYGMFSSYPNITEFINYYSSHEQYARPQNTFNTCCICNTKTLPHMFGLILPNAVRELSVISISTVATLHRPEKSQRHIQAL